MAETFEYIILGGGVTGLAAASQLGDSAVVLEQSERPGGLVRVDCYDGFWFDHVLHLLHFSDGKAEALVRSLFDQHQDLAPCPPLAWVQTEAGLTRYPFQTHLYPLERETVIRCLLDFIEARQKLVSTVPQNFEEWLVLTFGKEMCRVFMLPYNRKVWKRPLDTLAPAGFTWTIAAPEIESVIRGALDPNASYRAYNENAWYPRPEPGAHLRGMEVLSHRLADRVSQLRLGHKVIAIDPKSRVVTALHNGTTLQFTFRRGCLSTLPLPLAIRICTGAPESLAQMCRGLLSNRVINVMLSINGVRPRGSGLWRYYADENVCFNRLVFMHEFDPLTAPPSGWGLMAEITEPSEAPSSAHRWLMRAIADVKRIGIMPDGCIIKDAHLRVVDPAYVVFTPHSQPVVEAARLYLEQHGIFALGRYGRWEYSSMARNITDGVRWAESQSLG
jgi:UDP-galactopyranose mutase